MQMLCQMNINEISRFAALKAISALSKYAETAVGINVHIIDHFECEEKEAWSRLKKEIISLCVPIHGDLFGFAVLVFEREQMQNLGNVFKEKTFACSPETEAATLSEVANIIIGNFLPTFSEYLNIQLWIHEMAIINSGFIEDTIRDVATISNDPLDNFLKIYFSFQGDSFKGNVIFMFEEKRIQNLLAVA